MSDFKKANALIKVGRYKEALDILEKLKRQKPGFLPYEQSHSFVLRRLKSPVSTLLNKSILRSSKTETCDVHVLFVLPESLECNNGYQCQLLARHLHTIGVESTIAVSDEVSVQNIHNVEFSIIKYSSLLESAFAPYTIIHAWTPREKVRRVCESYLEKNNIPLIVHLEDNEEYLTALSVGKSWKDLLDLSIEELDNIIPINRYHPRRGREFLDRAVGLTMVIETLNRFNTQNVPYVLIPPMADERLFYPRPINYSLRQNLGIPDSAIVLCYTGTVNIANRKDVFELYKAVEMLNAEGYPAVLLHTGIDKDGLTNDLPKTHVINLGFVKREELPEIIAATDILVQPGGNSSFDNERIPSKIPEYFSSGRPTILSKNFLDAYNRIHTKVSFLNKSTAEEIFEVVKKQIKTDHDKCYLKSHNPKKYFICYLKILQQLSNNTHDKYKHAKPDCYRKRILIVDPVCANKYGHNLHALRRNADFLYKNFVGTEVIVLASKYLELDRTNTSFIKPILNFYYHSLIKIDNNIAKKESQLESSLPIDDLHYLQIQKAQNDVIRYHEEYELSNNDIVFYPGIDYYSIIGLLSYWDTVNPKFSPKYILRWISVMENSSFIPEKIENILEKIRLKKNLGFKIINSAESASYAKYLALHLQEPVIVTPLLIEEEFLDYPSNKKHFNISFPGSSRSDKGIEILPDILDILETLGIENFRVDLQFPDPLTLNAIFPKILSLCCKDYVEIQPYIISSEAILNNLRRSDCIILPYLPDVYKYRSSAIVAECGVYGRPVVCSKGCGFSEEVDYFKLGFTVETPSEFAQCIYQLYATPIEQRITIYKHTSNIYRKYILSCYQLLFRG